jgi:hypothetical protein
MPRITLYVVQCFIEVAGQLVAEEPIEMKTAAGVKALAERLARTKAGVRVIVKSVDAEARERNSTPWVLFRSGTTGETAH